MKNKNVPHLPQDRLCQVPPGEYEVMYVCHETNVRFRGPKLVIHFRITGPSHIGEQVAFYCNVARTVGPLGLGGEFEAGPKSKLFRSFVNLFEPHTKVVEKVDMNRFPHTPVIVRVREVTEGDGGIPLAPATRYSVIDQFLSVSHEESDEHFTI